MEYVPNQAIEEIRRMAQPTLLSVAEIAASEQDDIAIPAPVAFGMHDAVAERFGEVLAVLGAVCSQALHVTDRTPAPPLVPLLEFIREHFPPVQSRRPLGEDAQRLADAISTTIHAPDQPPSWA
jgi:histidine ammonia-lyase